MEEIYTAIATIVAIVFALFLYLFFLKTRNVKRHSVTSLKSISKSELAKYTDITKLSRKTSKGTLSRSNRRTEDSRVIYSITLLTPSHRKKIYIENHEKNDVAMERLKLLAQKLNKKIVKFNPQISKKTKDRRR